VQSGDEPRASLLPPEPHVVAEVHACVPRATSEPSARGGSQIAFATAECCGPSCVRKCRLAAQRVPEVEVEKAAGSISPSVLPPVGAATGLPRSAVAEGDSGLNGVAVSTGSETLRRESWGSRPAICDPGSRQTPRTKLDCTSKTTLGTSARGQRVKPHRCERNLRRRVIRGKRTAHARTKRDGGQRRSSKQHKTKKSQHLGTTCQPTGKVPRLRQFGNVPRRRTGGTLGAERDVPARRGQLRDRRGALFLPMRPAIGRPNPPTHQS
jgi:hypothetical protein